jgi:glucose-6-phosphate 1-dehydrogenase
VVAQTIPVKSFDLVIFGATGDLAHRKIFPALYNRLLANQMPMDAIIIGIARQNISTDGFKKLVERSLLRYTSNKKLDKKTLNLFLSRLTYLPLDAESDENWGELKKLIRKNTIRAFYLSVAPTLFDKIASRISKIGVVSDTSRIVIEKPLGVDERTARDLNKSLKSYFKEEQIYRIDHYLGKETVQNLMALRFANILFEPLWNSNFIDHVQITVSETIGVSGRGDYYDKTGAIKDMLQNHIMQLLCLTAMEPPSRFEPDAVRDEKLKVIHALNPVSTKQIVRGQYWDTNEKNYRVDVNNRKSRTESYVALKVSIANWRWANTPFYIRTGKKMAHQFSEIAIFFKELPHSIFNNNNQETQNKLIIRLQPNDRITLTTNIKEPGPGGMRLTSAPLDMTFSDAVNESSKKPPDAYERLIMDVIRGDQTLFMRGDEVEAAWKWTDNITKEWTNSNENPEEYQVGSDGPPAAKILIEGDRRKWRNI